MKVVVMTLLLVASLTLPGILPGQELRAEEDLKAKVEMLERELNALKNLMLKQQTDAAKQDKIVAGLVEKTDEHAEKMKAADADTGPGGEKGKFTYSGLWIPDKSEEFAQKGISPQFGGVYTKPFVRKLGRNTYLGGYMDASYRAQENSNNRFEVLRFVPFIYADVSDRVKVAAEIEFEHGGAQTKHGDITDSFKVVDTSGKTQSIRTLNGEVKLEFATIDFLIRDEINFRAGLILAPLGKYNLVHDAPLQDLIDRPLVDRLIIPTTFTMAGMGFYGTFYPTEMSKVDYEIYATNGIGNDITSGNGLRNARFFRYDRDNNKNPGVVGRVAYSPFLGAEVGGSFFVSKYDRSNYLNVLALDFAFEKGPFELVGEGAYTDIERDKRIKVSQPTVPPSMWGFYIEPRFHFMPEVVHNLAPNFFKDDSTFTLVARWDQMDSGFHRLQQRATAGFNFRYTEDTVFKVDYQWNMEQGQPHVDNNAFLFGVASFF